MEFISYLFDAVYIYIYIWIILLTTFYDTYQASSYLSVTSRSPLRAMKVSRPQHLMNPVEKWGSPAANEAMGSSSGVDGGSWAELLTP